MALKWMAKKSSSRNPTLHHAAMTVAEVVQDLVEGLLSIQEVVAEIVVQADQGQAVIAGAEAEAVAMTVTDHLTVTRTMTAQGNVMMTTSMTSRDARGSDPGSN